MQDLKDFLARWERPDNTILGISGEQILLLCRMSRWHEHMSWHLHVQVHLHVLHVLTLLVFDN